MTAYLLGYPAEDPGTPSVPSASSSLDAQMRLQRAAYGHYWTEGFTRGLRASSITVREGPTLSPSRSTP